MEIIVTHEQGRVPVTIFQISGEIVVNNYQQLEAKAREAFEAGTRNLLLDLSNVTYISSSGLRALHTIYTLLRSDSPEESKEALRTGIRAGTYKSPHLKLLNPSQPVLEVLRMSGYDMFLEIHRRRDEAIASF